MPVDGRLFRPRYMRRTLTLGELARIGSSDAAKPCITSLKNVPNDSTYSGSRKKAVEPPTSVTIGPPSLMVNDTGTDWFAIAEFYLHDPLLCRLATGKRVGAQPLTANRCRVFVTESTSTAFKLGSELADL